METQRPRDILQVQAVSAPALEPLVPPQGSRKVKVQKEKLKQMVTCIQATGEKKITKAIKSQ